MKIRENTTIINYAIGILKKWNNHIVNYSVDDSTRLKMLILLLFTFFFGMHLIISGHNEYVNQTAAWLNGKLDIPMAQCGVDSVIKNGKCYWTLGPAPSVLLLPMVVLLGSKYYYSQNILNTVSIFLSFVFAYKIATKLKASKTKSVLLATTLIFASTYINVLTTPTGWAIAHSTTVLFSLLAIHEYLNKKRFFLIGLLVAVATATRITTGLGIIFFIYSEINSKSNFSKKIANVLKLTLPVGLTVLLLTGFNVARFGNVSESGYIYLADNIYFPLLEQYYSKPVHHNLFHISNIPKNFATYFLTTIGRGVLGLNINFFLVSLPFLYVFKTKISDKYVKEALTTSFLILIVLLSYYWPGADQLGPRYTLDLLPFLYIPLCVSLRNSKKILLFKLLMLLSIFINSTIIGYKEVYVLTNPETIAWYLQHRSTLTEIN